MTPVEKKSLIELLIENAECHTYFIDNYDYNLFVGDEGSQLSFSNAMRIKRDSDHIAIVRKLDGQWHVKLICPKHFYLLDAPWTFSGFIKRLFKFRVNG